MENQYLTAEISLYPLLEHYEPPILDFIAHLNSCKGVEVHTHSTATKVSGLFDDVYNAVGECMKLVSGQGVKYSCVVKYLNLQLPVIE